MSRVRVTLLILALAGAILPAAADASPRATGKVVGVVEDGSTASPFDPATHTPAVDVVNTATRERFVTFIFDATGFYEIPNLPVGTYRARVRVFPFGPPIGLISHYEWHGGTNSFDTATDFAVTAAGTTVINFSPPLVTLGKVRGHVFGATTSALANCVTVSLVESSGVGVGFIFNVDPTSEVWRMGGVPVGDYTAVATTFTNGGFADCDPPSFLSGWYGGGSAGPDILSGPELARLPGFATGSTFTVTPAGVSGIDINLAPVPLCRGLYPTIFGTGGNDTLLGTGGADVIVGLQGRDRIWGFAGNDALCGGDQKDKIFGGSGADRIFGERGNDVLRGQTGNDRIDGGPGNDNVRGQGGNDKLLGRQGDDFLHGGGGFDKASGGPGVDNCIAEVTTASCP